MSIAINPVTYSASISAVGANNARTNAARASQYAAYEQYLELQSQNDLISSTGNTTVANANDNVLLTSDLLDLSPAALNVLNGVSADTGTSTAIVGALAGQTNLSVTQQQQASAIVSQFASSPLTQQTLDQIQAALNAVGIDPTQISIRQLFNVYSYNYFPGLPTGGNLDDAALADEIS